ncbi:hypothetical protein AK830_g10553 [Neonectria ditissima]|uniref:Zn(2)-C6 fungal-type domain-containing protein n=1 Tax=Neonectria ditissima TaxID=78410 RepID=A0A0P7ATA0_9HYPO|nr:hypothetical protein AK830_g10553 [Neonectria ditissima]
MSNSRNQTHQSVKPHKACVPCRTRKVKCDAALTGIPCGGCVVRKCADSCVLASRKRRRVSVAGKQYEAVRSHSLDHSIDSGHSADLGPQQLTPFSQDSSLQPLCPEDSAESQNSVHYLGILREALDHGREKRHTEESLNSNSRQLPWLTQDEAKPSQFDAIDNDYLKMKGVFDLPPQQHLEALLQTYFDDTREDVNARCSKVYRRMWWVLYCRDVLLSFFGAHSMRLLSGRDNDVAPLTRDDWEDEDTPEACSHLLLPITEGQKLYIIEFSKLAVIGERCLSIVTKHQEHDPRDLMVALDTWRSSLRIQHEGSSGELCHAILLASSYRFESVLARLLRMWWKSRNVDTSEWAKKRLRSAIFELDTISGRMLAKGILPKLPMVFITSLAPLTALHIEAVLDPTESDLTRSISRISLSQAMLMLKQVREIPAIQRAIPIFEQVIAQNNICSVPTDVAGWDTYVSTPTGQRHEPENSTALDAAHDEFLLHDASEEYKLWFRDLLGFDYLDSQETWGFNSFSI